MPCPVVTICKEMRMAMAHRLPHHEGKCHRLHGHSYVVRVYVTGPLQAIDDGNPQSGMVVDFDVVKDFLKLVEACMDHQFGNETVDDYPTAERIALRIMAIAQEQMVPHLPAGVRVSRIRVYEEYVAPQAFAEVEG
jgi:6-pyruvoyltetrahydropterin/6-carboxytetrahydropterin synthase